MSFETQTRANTLAWSNPVAVWWLFLSAVSAANIAVWFLLYRQFHQAPAANSDGAFGLDLMFFLCAAYVFGCAFRSVLPRADVQRICLFDTWLSCVAVGRSVATVAEVSFAMQWAIVLYWLGTTKGADTALFAAWVIVPLIVTAQCLSWYGVLTKNYLANAIENSLWAVAFFIVGIALVRLLPEFHGVVRIILAVALAGIAGFIAFLVTVDVPMYLSRWRAGCPKGSDLMSALEGFRDACSRWVVTHDIAEWREEIPWMSLYFSGAVWASLALCAFYSFDGRMPF